MVTQVLRSLHISTLILGLALAPVAHALKVQVNRQMMIRTAQGANLNFAGYVQPGTVVEIPDKYVIVDSSGRVNTELTLNHWLREAGYTQDDVNGRGSGERNDFFFPVKVNGGTYYMSLRLLAREQGALVVQQFGDIYNGSSDDTPLMSNEREPAPAAPSAPAPAPAPHASSDSPTSFDRSEFDRAPERRSESAPPQPPPPTAPPARMESAPPCSDCIQLRGSPGPISQLRAMVQPALNEVARDYEDNRQHKTQIDQIAANFRRTCGFEISSFSSEITAAASRNNVPVGMLFSILGQESMGECYPAGRYKGLFQVEPTRQTAPACTQAQLNQLRGLRSVGALKSGPQCLQNPVVNVAESARILKAKLDYLMTVLPRNQFVRTDGRAGYTSSAWRLAAAAYNGGEGYIQNAYNSMREFNRKNGSNYQPTNWEDFKVFMFRNHLDANQQRSMYGTVKNDGRSVNRIVLNAMYAETVVPTHGRDPNRQSSVEAWYSYLQRHQTR